MEVGNSGAEWLVCAVSFGCTCCSAMGGLAKDLVGLKSLDPLQPHIECLLRVKVGRMGMGPIGQNLVDKGAAASYNGLIVWSRSCRNSYACAWFAAEWMWAFGLRCM